MCGVWCCLANPPAHLDTEPAMFDFDELFTCRDPYGSFTAEIDEQEYVDPATRGKSCSSS